MSEETGTGRGVLEGEPPEGAGEVDWAAVAVGAGTGEISFGM
jgi:hypothetical protein